MVLPAPIDRLLAVASCSNSAKISDERQYYLSAAKKQGLMGDARIDGEPHFALIYDH